jgi:O-antigen ligase
MDALIAQTFQPNAPADDPVWGFALVDDKLQTQPAWSALERAMKAPVQSATFNAAAFYGALVALVLAAAVATWRGAVAASHIPWAEGWRRVAARFAALPPIVQFAALALTVAAFYYSPNGALNFILLALVALFFSFRLDLGLALAVFAIPFYLLPKNLVGSLQFSLVEVLTLAALAALLLRDSSTGILPRAFENIRAGNWKPRLESPDWAIVFFVLAGLVSVKVAANFGVANREFRVIVLEPALLYALVRAGGLTPRDLHRLVDAFILSAVAVSLIGLEQYFFTNYVIIGEGVRRVLAVYGSPNNLALYLERALPVGIALALFAQDRARRIAYAAAALAIAFCIYLTWSRGAWLLGLPAGLVVIGLASGRRARLAVAALVVVGAIVLIPFLGTERAQSLFQTGTGTGFFRVSVWQSGVAMIRDHPLLGVGLDNFLYEYPKYMQPEAWREPNLSHPHNIVLDFWVRMGVLGLIALAWMLFEFYRRGIRGVRQGEGDRRVLLVGLLAGLTAGLAHGMIDAAYFYVDLAFVFMLMFAATVSGSEKAL